MAGYILDMQSKNSIIVLHGVRVMRPALTR